MHTIRKGLLWGQGLLYVLAGAWPLLHMPSFLAVTGPKNEVWLVVTVGVLVLAIGAAMLCSACQTGEEASVGLLAFFCALGLAAVDVRYATREVIRDVYLLDAAIESVFALGWLWVFWKGSRPRRD